MGLFNIQLGNMSEQLRVPCPLYIVKTCYIAALGYKSFDTVATLCHWHVAAYNCVHLKVMYGKTVKAYVAPSAAKISADHLRYEAVVAEWLRRWTRNPLGSARAGSNPADCACFGTPKTKPAGSTSVVLLQLFLFDNLLFITCVIGLPYTMVKSP